jgi:hypothetical protein
VLALAPAAITLRQALSLGLSPARKTRFRKHNKAQGVEEPFHRGRALRFARHACARARRARLEDFAAELLRIADETGGFYRSLGSSSDAVAAESGLRATIRSARYSASCQTPQMNGEALRDSQANPRK